MIHLSDSDLLKRFEAGKARLAAQQVKIDKYVVAQKVAQEKKLALEKELRDLGVDPDGVDEWLQQEEKRLKAEMDAFEAKMSSVDKTLSEIENNVKTASGGSS